MIASASTMQMRAPPIIVFVLAFAAAAAPSLLVYNVAPSPTFLNQALACALWGAFVAVCTPRLPSRGAGLLWITLALLGAAVLCRGVGGACRKAWRCRHWACW